MNNSDDTISVKGETCKVIYTFPVLWHAWEYDGDGWVVEHQGYHKLVLSNHGSKYFATKEDLMDRVKFYHTVLIKSADAMKLIDSE